uniref:Arylsulfatase B n=3 Tax=Lygus hesperus TaxID=30085 RepID=A0A0A9YCM5_LYGHE
MLKIRLSVWLAIAFCSTSLKGSSASSRSRPPHVVFILADDMGWNDVGFHGSDQIPTPNIDALAFNGLILNQHYAPALCTPSRAALLTGKYPIHTGMQHLVILESEPWGLGLKEKLLPEMLSQAGYRSHAVGKWHLGFYRKEYTPTFRGFDSHFGYWQGFHDYYNHSVRATYEPYDGYDMRRGLEVDWSVMGKYSTDIFTQEAVKIVEDHDSSSPLLLYLAHLAPHTGNMRDPFQAPDDVVAKFSHIRDPERRTYAAMVSKLDESVGEVVAALRRKHMLENSVIVFMSDNGAPTHGIHSNRGSNFPCRGIKNSAWEGGNRVAAAVWSPLIKKPKRVANQMMHMVDWLPTFYSLAGFNSTDLNVDGVDMWEALSEDKPSPRKEILYNIDDVGNPYAAIRRGDWKYVSGSATGDRNNGWYGESGSDSRIGYHPEDVLMSKAGVAISAFVIKQQIQHKIRTESRANSVLDEEEEAPPRLLDSEEMLRLRRQAVVECGVSNATDTADCNPQESPCLFNIRQDPCEKVNLASLNKMILLNLEERVRRFRSTMLKARNVPSDVTADPGLWNNTWSCWQDEMESQNLLIFRDLPGTLAAFLYTTLAFLVIVILLVFYPKLIPSSSIEPKKSKIMSVFTLYSGQVAQGDKKPSS